MAVLQCKLRAEVETVRDEPGDVLWSSSATVGDCSSGMVSEEVVSCVVDCAEIMELCGICCRLHWSF